MKLMVHCTVPCQLAMLHLMSCAVLLLLLYGLVRYKDAGFKLWWRVSGVEGTAIREFN